MLELNDSMLSFSLSYLYQTISANNFNHFCRFFSFSVRLKKDSEESECDVETLKSDDGIWDET